MPVLSASFSADGSRIVSGSFGNTATVLDAKTGDLVLTLKGHALMPSIPRHSVRTGRDRHGE